jgi:hypothetical protein
MISESMRKKILKLFSMAEDGYGNEAELFFMLPFFDKWRDLVC